MTAEGNEEKLACSNLYAYIGEDPFRCNTFNTSYDENIVFKPVDVSMTKYLEETNLKIKTDILSEKDIIQAENKKIEDVRTSEKRLNVVKETYKKIRILYYAFFVFLVVILIILLLSYSKIF